MNALMIRASSVVPELRVDLPVVAKRAFKAHFTDQDEQEIRSDDLDKITLSVAAGPAVRSLIDAREATAEDIGPVAYSWKAYALLHLTWITFVCAAVAIAAGLILSKPIYGVLGAAIGMLFTISFFACALRAGDERKRHFTLS